jgi:hypothetical protein
MAEVSASRNIRSVAPGIPDEGRIMITRSYLFAMAIALLYVTVANAQYPVVDAIANKVAQKYQTSSCEQLWQQRSQKKPPTQQEQEAVQMLRNDAKMRASFVNIVAAPVVNKMIECGMIP